CYGRCFKMVQILLLAESVDELSVGFYILVIPIDSVVEVCFDLEEQAKVWVGVVESLVYLMVARQDNFHVPLYRLRSETLCTCNAEPLARFFDGDVSALKSSLEPLI